jgi:hypothetical protein
MAFRYTLETKRQRKHRCPSCGQKRFVRYIDNETGEYLAGEVGKCDRSENCQYHLTPSQWGKTNIIDAPQAHFKPITAALSKSLEYLHLDLVEASMKPAINHFTAYLSSLFGAEIAKAVRLKYLIGSSKHWEGATVFWQVDEQDRARYGKVMLYNPETGKRVKSSEGRACIIGAHSILGKRDMNYRQCFFGQHLLAEAPERKIGIVESEKTAIISSLFFPEFTWLATGGKNGVKLYDLNVVSVLRGKKIVMFPDLGAYEEWEQKAAEISRLVECQIKVSSKLENIATSEQRKLGLDLVDYLVKRDESAGWALTDENYPVMWDLQEHQLK